jgi:hypothetical protein
MPVSKIFDSPVLLPFSGQVVKFIKISGQLNMSLGPVRPTDNMVHVLMLGMRQILEFVLRSMPLFTKGR